MNAAKILLCAFGLCLPLTAAANGGDLSGIALAAKQQNATPAMPWLGDMRINDKHAHHITLADGNNLMQRPRVVRSYSDAAQYDVSHFYKPDKLQVNIVMHYAGRRAGEIISLGFDSGFSARKIKIAPALFAGYTRAYRVARSTHITASAGGWFGGEVTHEACRDAFDREYFCPTLTAWSDYRPSRQKLQRYLHLTWTHDF